MFPPLLEVSIHNSHFDHCHKIHHRLSFCISLLNTKSLQKSSPITSPPSWGHSLLLHPTYSIFPLSLLMTTFNITPLRNSWSCLTLSSLPQHYSHILPSTLLLLHVSSCLLQIVEHFECTFGGFGSLPPGLLDKQYTWNILFMWTNIKIHSLLIHKKENM